ncbi:MAG TPA: TraX family protein [Clostridium sp.]|uniref:TraX family protein n=1 Tax=Clostridium sp. TaxID=1506 RepID=UPI002F958241
MTSSMLKIIACLLMLIDHTGAVFFPKVLILRMIGRLSFPIFAYLIAMGYSKTHSFSKYFSRLVIFAAVSQIPFSLAFGEKVNIQSLSAFITFFVVKPYPHLNVFFTLTVGLLAIRIWDKGKSKFGSIFIILALGIVAKYFNTDYGIYGVVMILTFYIFRNSKIKIIISQVIVYILFNASENLYYCYKFQVPKIEFAWFIQVLSLLALIIIFLYNGKKGKNLKYIFYVFYPLHLLVIGLIKNFM